jgi:hypothetical protein
VTVLQLIVHACWLRDTLCSATEVQQYFPKGATSTTSDDRRPRRMASSRPRRAASQPAALSANIQRGLASICEGNEDVITQMLGAEATGRSDTKLTDKLAQVMAVNSLSAELMLARFFDASVLGAYCVRLGKSDKGPAATLAARIAKEWQRPDFSMGADPEAAEAPAANAAASTWTAPTWLELQTDSDDDEQEAERKKQLKAEMRRAKATGKAAAPAAPAPAAPAPAAPAPAAPADSETKADSEAPDSKRRKLEADIDS